jgi:hypothetical protein
LGWNKSLRDDVINVLAGTCDSSLNWLYEAGAIEGYSELKFNGWARKTKRGMPVKRYLLNEALDFAIADESTAVTVIGAASWAAAGAIIAGPVGAAVGGLLGGRGENVTFAAKFADGNTMLGQVPKKLWLKMYADRF